MAPMRIGAFLRRLLRLDVHEDEHTRLRGPSGRGPAATERKGKYVQFPTDMRELDEKFGPVMRELAKQSCAIWTLSIAGALSSPSFIAT